MADVPHDEFGAGVEALIADAILALLAADDELVAYLATGLGIVPFETDLFLATDKLRAPMLGVAISRVAETREGEQQAAQLETEIVFYLLTAQTQLEARDGWLRTRVLNRIKSLVQTNDGVLALADAARLNVALTRFQQVNVLGRLVSQGNNLVVTELKALFLTSIDEATREPIE